MHHLHKKKIIQFQENYFFKPSFGEKIRGKWHPLEGHFPYEITLSDELTHEDRLGSYPRRGAIFGKKVGDLRVIFFLTTNSPEMNDILLTMGNFYRFDGYQKFFIANQRTTL